MKENHNVRLYVKVGKKEGYDMLILRAVTAVVLFVAALLGGTSMFHLEYHVLWPLLVGALLIVAMTVLWQKKIVIYAIILGVAGFFIVGFLLRSRFAVDGLMIVLNQAIRAVGIQTTRIYRQFSVEVTDENSMLFATFFMTMLAGMLAVFCALTIHLRSKTLLLIMLSVFLLLSLKLQILPGRKHCMLLLFGCLLAFGVIGTYGQEIRTYAYAGVFLVPVLFLSIGIAMLISPAEGTSPLFAGLIESLRYEQNLADNYPKGQLSELETLDKSEDTALLIIMETPYATYLRGYVGSYFDNQNWCATEQEITFDYSGMFDWLHENGFYATTQLSCLFALSAEYTETVQQVEIEAVGADRRYLYLPYEVTSVSAFSLQKNNDETALSANGQEAYQFNVCGSIWTDTVALGTLLFEAQEQERSEATAYLAQESYYNAFVYAQYTAITEETRAVFDRLGAVSVETEDGRISYEDANAYVLSFLTEMLSYDETADYSAKDEDFLRSLLMEEKSGCDVHYATVAALYYRYLGIPARYVEGYVVTSEDAAAMEAGSAYALTGQNAHAWVEIYMDTIGWVPVEVTPGYEASMSVSQ